MLIAADIGGTTSRFALADDQGRVMAEHHYPSAEAAGLLPLLERFLADTGTDAHGVAALVLALAGPLDDDCVDLTNLPWRVCRQELQAFFPNARVALINDFQAAALGALAAGEEHLLPLRATRRERGRRLALGPGTGLGVAYLHPAHGHWRAWPTEAGHIAFAPETEQEWALARHLIERHGRASWERILSGPGLAALHAWLAGRENPLPPPEVMAAAAAGEATAKEAMRLFARLLGRFAGDMALAWQPAGGVYLLGGVATHGARWLQTPAFLESFDAKGRLGSLVARYPVHIVMTPRAGLLGAVRHALQMQVRS